MEPRRPTWHRLGGGTRAPANHRCVAHDHGRLPDGQRGDTLTISISIADAVDLTSWQSFDKTIVQANGVTAGPFMSSFGTILFSPGVIDDASGLIKAGGHGTSTPILTSC